MLTCPQCGRENAANSKFCVHCGAAIPVQAAAPPPQQAGGYPQQGYQAPYRAARAPFMGDLHDHPPFILAFVLALACSFMLAFNIPLGPSQGQLYMAFTNTVVIFLFSLIFFAGGIVGLAGCFGLWRFREWGRNFVILSQGVFGVAGVLMLVGGGTHRGEGAATAAVILWGVMMLAIAAAVIFYMFTDEVRSRMQH